jgi:hypothetical protein
MILNNFISNFYLSTMGYTLLFQNGSSIVCSINGQCKPAVSVSCKFIIVALNEKLQN